MIELPRSLADALIEHAREGRPNEVCGVVGLRDGRVVRLEGAPNAAGTPQVRFTFDDDGYRLVMQVERDGLELGIYHSHPASPASPSATDRAEMSATWPDCLQLMISLRDDATSGPEIHAYRIDTAGAVTTEDLRIVD
ncbi:MAG: Mov34/MPN/PAD-1 family protein [Chloroflexota bacterium]